MIRDLICIEDLIDETDQWAPECKSGSIGVQTDVWYFGKLIKDLLDDNLIPKSKIEQFKTLVTECMGDVMRTRLNISQVVFRVATLLLHNECIPQAVN
jgi:hypothetical protein